MTVNFNKQVTGQFVTRLASEQYKIENVDEMSPFFMSIVSSSDHWLFLSSTGGLTAGRVSPETALFPYETVDKLHDSYLHTGCKTVIKCLKNEKRYVWEPFNQEQDGRFQFTRSLYKSSLGNSVCFEEINHDLQLLFSYTWETSDQYGFVRRCTLSNLSSESIDVEFIDGLQNILPAGTPRFTQTNSSNLVDAYKWTELVDSSTLGLYTLYSAITDRAEPCESLLANTVFSYGLENPTILLSTEQVKAFKKGHAVSTETSKRGIRGAYFVNQVLTLDANEETSWTLVANLQQSHSAIVALREKLNDEYALEQTIKQDVSAGSEHLHELLAKNDALQHGNDHSGDVHHYSNVLFNTFRGGTFETNYEISSIDFSKTIALFNQSVFNKHKTFLQELPQTIALSQLGSKIIAQNDEQLTRLFQEYLPISFGRRHGDPSRPWNQFEIKLIDENKEKIISYQGNWRDIFQNWEALCKSYPLYIEHVIAKFVNASTLDGYNPYRITKEGIDWEVEDLDDPWSYIGYWGDHQIIYLLKLLELSHEFAPEKLSQLLGKSIFSYANVPYEIANFDAMVADAKHTVNYNEQLANTIEQRVKQIGSDGKLLLDSNNKVYQVNLMEKLLVTLLAKLSNFVINGGIWLNTQRPEWNDANNALVGQGLSVVTLCYIRRYLTFIQQTLLKNQQSYAISSEVVVWFKDTNTTFINMVNSLQNDSMSNLKQSSYLSELGQAASQYRQKLYDNRQFSGKTQLPSETIAQLVKNALVMIDDSLTHNLRDDGLFNAYNTVEFTTEGYQIQTLYPMLEGQVAALSSGFLTAKQSVDLLAHLFASDMYLPNQHSFLLYPDKQVQSFLKRNTLQASTCESNALLSEMLANNDYSIIEQDIKGNIHFKPSLINTANLIEALSTLQEKYQDKIKQNQQAIIELYEQTFNHQAFTGRSGGMFGFEGLGCIYWHMVSKLMLAIQECYLAAIENNEPSETIQQLSDYYYRVRQGIGFNKSPEEYGAFPFDPYSHTPKHAGAQQPGMTGQVKEEILTRFKELGVMIQNGQLCFEPTLLKQHEFITEPSKFHYFAIHEKWQNIAMPANSFAFTYCQVPVIYTLTNQIKQKIEITYSNQEVISLETNMLSEEDSHSIFEKANKISQIMVFISPDEIHSD